MALAAAATVLFSAWVLVGLEGARYYRTPLRARVHDAAHPVLRSSGTAGLAFGVAGTLCMLVPVVYAARKRMRRLHAAGPMRAWLEVHIFCGIFGPVLITYHTAFKFDGIVSMAYWSMVLVACSGFVGRYLYVRIPRTIRGVEMTSEELHSRAAALKRRLTGATPAALLERLQDRERDMLTALSGPPTVTGFLFGGWPLRRRLAALERELQSAGADADTLGTILGTLAERTLLLRRLAYLRTTRRLFHGWHVFHLPLVYVMFVIVALHIGVAVYLGYAFFW